MNRRSNLIFLSLAPFFVCIFLAFLDGSAVLNAQTESNDKVTSSVKTEDGLETVSFDTLNGVVEVALPDDLSDSDTISGTVLVEEKRSNSKEQISQNEDELAGVVVEIEKCKGIKEPDSIAKSLENCKDDKPPEIPPCVASDLAPCIELGKEKEKEKDKNKKRECSFTFLVPPSTGEFKILLKHKKTGAIICSQEIKALPARNSELAISASQPPKCEFPKQCSCDKAFLIPGRYDGRFVTSRVKIEGQDCRVLAESPRKQIIQTPKDCPQNCKIESSECGFISKGVIKLIPASTLASETKNLRKSSGRFDGTVGAAAQESDCPDLNGNWIANVTPLGGTISGPKGETSVAPNQSPSTQHWRIKHKGNKVTFPCGTSFEMNGCSGVYRRGGASNELVRKLSYDKAADTLQMDDEERQQGGGVTSVMRWTIKMQRQK